MGLCHEGSNCSNLWLDSAHMRMLLKCVNWAKGLELMGLVTMLGSIICQILRIHS